MSQSPSSHPKSTPSGVFISYSRKDGAEFALLLRDKLSTAGIEVKQDRIVLEGGRDWWLQLEEAIKESRFLILVMTPTAMQSEYVRKEWRLARQEGVCVYPVKAGTKADFDHLITTLPRWMRDMHFYDLGFDPARLETSAEWATLLADLRQPCAIQRVPYMVEDLPADYVRRDHEINALIDHLLDPARENPVAITAALKGAGGYGKTTLARAICHDERIQNAFDDGILWVTLGETPGDLTGRVLDLVATLTGARPAVSGLDAAKTEFAKALADRDVLLVIDDAWDSAHVKPFLSGGNRCARLITTRDAGTLPSDAPRVDVDALQTNEANQLLRAGLPLGETAPLAALAERLGNWALLIKLANGALRSRVETKKQSLVAALEYVENALDELGLTAFDAARSEDRHRAVASTLGVSLRQLDERELTRFAELVIFPEDVDIPLPALEKLWGIKPIAAERLVERLDELSLLLRFDPNGRTIRLHDVVRDFLRRSEESPLTGGEAALPSIHARFLASYGITRWADLPAAEPYLWDALIYHLIEAGRSDEAARTLTDLRYVARKTFLRSPYAAETDLTRAAELPGVDALKTLKRQYGNMIHILNRCTTETEVMATLHGRLMEFDQFKAPCVRLAAEIPRPYITAWRTLPDLPHPALIRTLAGHTALVAACAIGTDFIVSASYDGTLKVWDSVTGQERFTLTGHTEQVGTCAVGDGFIVSGSWDHTVRLWDSSTGQILAVLRGHSRMVNGCAVGKDFIVSASRDGTLKVWDLASHKPRFTLRGHTDSVKGVAVGLDFIVSASTDRTLKVWDSATGHERFTLAGHTDDVECVAVGQDFIVSASADRTLKVWDSTTGHERFTLNGHTGMVTGCAVGSDFIVSASTDHTLKVWDSATGHERFTLNGHADFVHGCAVGPGFMTSVSEDGTIKLWDINFDQRSVLPRWHDSWVYDCAFTRNGVISASADNTVKIWDFATGRERFTLHTRAQAVGSSAESDVTVIGTSDGNLSVRDSLTNAERFQLPGSSFKLENLAVSAGLIVGAWSNDSVNVWESDTGKLRFVIQGGNRVAIGTDFIVVAGNADTITFYDQLTGEKRFSLPHSYKYVRDLAIGADCILFTLNSTQTIHIWDSLTHNERFTLDYHQGSTEDIAAAAKLIVSCSQDCTLKIMDSVTGELLATFYTDDFMQCCAVHPDGEHIIAGGYKGLYWLRFVR